MSSAMTSAQSVTVKMMTRITMLRKRGEKFLGSKYIVILVIILTVTDCALVIAELILDLYSVKHEKKLYSESLDAKTEKEETLLTTEKQTFNFITGLKDRYPEYVKETESVATIFNRIADSSIVWNGSDRCACYQKANSSDQSTETGISEFQLPLTHLPSSPLSIHKPVMRGFDTGNGPHQDRTASDEHVYRKTVIVQGDPGNSSRKNATRHRHRRRSQRESPFNNPFRVESETHHLSSPTSTEGILRLLPENITEGILRLLPENIRDVYRAKLDRLLAYTAHGFQTCVARVFKTARKYTIPLLYEFVNRSGENTPSSRPLRRKFGDAGDVNLEASVKPHNTIYILTSKDTDQNDYVQRQKESPRKKRDTGGGGTASHGGGSRGDGKHIVELSMRREMHHTRELEIAHKLHYASVFVVSVLLVMVIMKVICKGKNFLKRKIEVFDAVVVVTSVVVDLIFIKGLTEFAVDETIFVLALLLPWRVIRVVNSLVMAVIDHEHVKLRLLYSRKKKLDKTVESLRNETDELKGMIQDVRQFCIKEGIESTKIDGLLGKFAPRRRKDSKFYTLVKLVMSTASINNNDQDSVSSSSMENDLRDYANRQSVLNEASNDVTVSSLRQYLSVPFFSTSLPGPGSSAVSSDQESVGGADSGISKPSIFITSPPSDEKMAPSPSDVDVELGRGRQSPFGSDMDGSIGSVGSDGDAEDGEFSDVFEEEEEEGEGLSERKHFLSYNDQDCFADNEFEDPHSKTEVAFYLGSRASLNNLTFPEDSTVSSSAPAACDTAAQGDWSSGQNEPGNSTTPNGGAVNGSDLIFIPDENLKPQQFGRFLTVPLCTVPASVVTTTAIFSNSNNNNTDNFACGLHKTDSAVSSSQVTMQNATLQNDKSMIPNDPESKISPVTSNSLPSKEASVSTECGSLSNNDSTPVQKLSTSDERRKRFASSSPPKITSSFDVKDSPNSGEDAVNPCTLLLPRESSDASSGSRARSESPGVSAMSLLKVPGCDNRRRSVDSPGESMDNSQGEGLRGVSSSKSMNDMTADGNGNPFANNVGRDGKILRSSCLSLNSARHKRRGKSPHRVSFKVS
ncbi:hypothetical protein EGW08_012242 [Elysia chlorotica]|uniref:Voltage-gated hydrogen channel 1 n=1 Tax=Elysia chlorotica TaxID=188477 RepID=A0A433TEL2_ELYCH|nr:hypothetical protein EGW08_012242 [Elysia chlorotica]